MAKAGYAIVTGSTVTLSASTAKSVLGVQAPEEFGIDLKKVWFAFNGTTASDAPVLVELCRATFESNAPGTNSTAVTPQQLYGRTIAHGVSAARNWTSEPTQLTTVAELSLTPNGGTLMYDWPLGDTPDCAPEDGFVLRLTAGAGVGVRATMVWERC